MVTATNNATGVVTTVFSNEAGLYNFASLLPGVYTLKAELPGWWYEGRWIRRKYNTDGWLTTLALVNTIGYVAEAAWHHPDLEVTWGKVWVKLRNHASNGVTDRDFEVAKRIEEVALWKPAPGGLLEGTPNKWVRGGSPDKPA